MKTWLLIYWQECFPFKYEQFGNVDLLQNMHSFESKWKSYQQFYYYYHHCIINFTFNVLINVENRETCRASRIYKAYLHVFPRLTGGQCIKCWTKIKWEPEKKKVPEWFFMMCQLNSVCARLILRSLKHQYF